MEEEQKGTFELPSGEILMEEIDFQQRTWVYPDQLCEQHGYHKYRITKTDQAWKSGNRKLRFYFFKDSDKIPNAMFEGMQCTSKKGKKFYTVWA